MVQLNLPRRRRRKPKLPPLCYIAAFALYQVTFDEWLAWVQHTIYRLQPIPPHLEALVPAIVWIGGPKHPVKIANGIRAVRAAVFKIGLERWTQEGVVKLEITSSGLHNDPLHRDPLGDHYTVMMRDANGRKLWGAMHIYPEHLGIPIENPFQDVSQERKMSFAERRGSGSSGKRPSMFKSQL